MFPFKKIKFKKEAKKPKNEEQFEKIRKYYNFFDFDDVSLDFNKKDELSLEPQTRGKRNSFHLGDQKKTYREKDKLLLLLKIIDFLLFSGKFRRFCWKPLL